MKKIKKSPFHVFVFVIVAFSTPAVFAEPHTITFDEYENTGEFGGSLTHPNPLFVGNYKFTAVPGALTPEPIANPPLLITQGTERYGGVRPNIDSPPLTVTNFGDLTMERSDGAPFNVWSIDVEQSGSCGKTFVFTGTFSDLSTVVLSFVKDCLINGLETVSLPGFVDIISLHISGGFEGEPSDLGLSNVGLIDNIVIHPVTFNYSGTCVTDCENLGLESGQGVTGFLGIKPSEATPGHILAESDILDFNFTFGNVVYDPTEVQVEPDGNVLINATGNGITGGIIKFFKRGTTLLLCTLRPSLERWCALELEPEPDYLSGSGTGTFNPDGIGETPVGEDVAVTPTLVDAAGDPINEAPFISLVYDSIPEGEAGVTTVEVVQPDEEGLPLPPSGFKLGDNGVYLDFTLIGGTFEGLVRVCIGYDEADYDDESTITLQHYDAGDDEPMWEDITLTGYPDTVNDVVCGDAPSFSWVNPFEEAAPPPPSDVDGPATTTTTANPNVVAIGSNVDLTANVDDSGSGGSNIKSADYSLDGGKSWMSMDASDEAFDEVSEDVQRSFDAPEAGIYTLCVRGTDALSNVDNPQNPQCIMLVVYDPSAGFVTGGGWINSPAGAYIADETMIGKANFGFVSKYKKGATVPTGSTEFQFKAGDLNFHSSSFEFLVITNGGTNAKFKGYGSINGELAPNGMEYRFMIWAKDDSPDAFRIKIWYEGAGEEVVYDNGVQQPIGGGSIVVHTKK